MKFLGAIFLCFAAFSQTSAPDLSGVWRWNPQKTHHSGKPPEDVRVKIEQKGDDIAITLRVLAGGQDRMLPFHYRIGVADNRNQINGLPMTSKAAWNGGVLAIDSSARAGERELHLEERWTLSPDKQTLTLVQRHQAGTEVGEDTTVLERQPDTAWEPPAPPKPAEQVYKNIQVMKGVPSDRLMGAMMFFTRSLGVECNYCHVPNEFEKDDKPTKNTARAMLKMVHQINDANFPANQVVSCWMCHRGSAKPEAFPK